MPSPGSPGFPEQVRGWMYEIHGKDLVRYESLEEARSDPDGAVVLSGEYGVAVFLTARARLVRCDAHLLVTLVSDLDAVSTLNGDPLVATVAFERHQIGTRIWGGGEGGLVADGVWTSPLWLKAPVRVQATEVVLGQRSRIDGDLLRQERDTRIAKVRDWRTRHPPAPPIEHLPWDFDIRPPAVPFPD
jgi:hypothetical protein